MMKVKAGQLITYRWLQVARACPQQATRFKNVFPNGAKLCTRNLNYARSKRLNTRWFIEKILGFYSDSMTSRTRWHKLAEYSGVNPRVQQWTKEMAPKIHAAFIRILKEWYPE